MKFDLMLGDTEELLREVVNKLSNIERLLEFLLSPPDLAKYKEGMKFDDLAPNIPRFLLYSLVTFAIRL